MRSQVAINLLSLSCFFYDRRSSSPLRDARLTRRVGQRNAATRSPGLFAGIICYWQKGFLPDDPRVALSPPFGGSYGSLPLC
jgi:hypothetical protein